MATATETASRKAAILGSSLFSSSSSFTHNSRSLEQGRAVAVNCSAGVSRSSTVVISFLLLHRNLTLRDAFTKVRSKRKYVYPNKGFWQLLIDLERGKNSSGRSMQHNNHTGQKCEGKNSADVTDFEAPETSVPMSALCMHAESNPFS
mmetsp:Transcript_17993/g.24946  ORF Transcript_17993/g.24946 Transcript_17993/m.24946 type:complete len:148 (-) Transcript_17993:29-472(-)